MNNKITFITELLNSKKIEASQKERLFMLTANELKKSNETDEKILAEIDAIKKQLANFDERKEVNLENEKQFNEDIIDSIESNMPNRINKIYLAEISKVSFSNENRQLDNLLDNNYMSPKDLKDFLIEYNQNDILKYTCHLIDGDALIKINSLTITEEYDFKKHLKIINKEFFNLVSKYKEKINKNIHGLIGEYLNNYSKNGWSSDKIKITWSSLELIEWAKLNPGKCPNPDPTLNSVPFNFKPFKINNQQTRVQNFNDIVLHFKSLFHIRRDNSLKSAIELVNNNYFLEIDDIDCSGIRENIEFFTDIDKVKQAYKKIIEMCNEFQNKINPAVRPFFSLSLKEDNDTIVFSIHHKNSIFGKTSINTITRQGEKTSKLIENLINGVCDLHLKADFGHEDYAEINLWNGMIKEIKKIESFEGVQFDLIFYR
jgi:hypothetical protein